MMPPNTPQPGGKGIWPSQWLAKAIESQMIAVSDASGSTAIDESQIQPASLDLRLGDHAYRLKCSFLPGKNDIIADRLKTFAIGPAIDIQGGAILERNRPYLIPLQETLALSGSVRAKTNPKSSTGRLDVFTRVIADRTPRFDEVRSRYRGPLYLEVVPRSFAIMVKTGQSLNQLRFISGNPLVSDPDIKALHRELPLLYRENLPLDRRDVRTSHGLFLTLDLVRRGQEPVGFRAKRNSNLIDLSLVGGHETDDYWEPVIPDQGNRIVLEPEEFYLLMSAEAIRIPPRLAAEMTAFDPSSGELRTHYAGFFDPGFGHDVDGMYNGSRAALEVRAHDVPFAIENRQRVCKLSFEWMVEEPSLLYGAARGSHYQGQETTLSKHFTAHRPSNQLLLPLRAPEGRQSRRASAPTADPTVVKHATLPEA